MDITFVGAGGGRMMTALQPKGYGTGGFILWKAHMFVDPGPGALLKARRLGVGVESLKYLYLSHAHLDHTGDASALAESMNGYTFKMRATLFLPKEAQETCAITPYHQSLFKEVVFLKEGLIPLPEGPLKVVAVRHTAETYGFVFGRVAYTSDTGYFPGLGEQLKADVLIANTIWEKRKTPFHLTLEDIPLLVSEGGFKKVILYHLGKRLWQMALEGELERRVKALERETGAEVLIAREGLQV